MNININGTHYILAALKELQPDLPFVFRRLVRDVRQRCRKHRSAKATPFHPRSPYGISKVAGFELTRNYREALRHVLRRAGFSFNHESPRRGFEFVTRKITSTLARIKFGLASELRLGNLEAQRDWGHAEDYVRAMHLMLQQPEPGDYVVATGETHSVREFCEAAFAVAGLNYQDYVKIDEFFYRPAEIDLLVGDASKARQILGWKPQHSFSELVQEMVRNDIDALSRNDRGTGIKRRPGLIVVNHIMSKQRILVTGGAGFLGSHLCERLLGGRA